MRHQPGLALSRSLASRAPWRTRALPPRSRRARVAKWKPSHLLLDPSRSVPSSPDHKMTSMPPPNRRFPSLTGRERCGSLRQARAGTASPARERRAPDARNDAAYNLAGGPMAVIVPDDLVAACGLTEDELRLELSVALYRD